MHAAWINRESSAFRQISRNMNEAYEVFNQLDQITKDRWVDLDRLLVRVEKYNISNLSAIELLHIGSLYNEVLSDLGRLRARNAEPEVLNYCNNLALRAYAIVYRTRSMSFRDGLLFFLCDFPELVRKRIHYVVAAAMIFFVASLVGYLCIHEKSRLIDLVISPAAQSHYREHIAKFDPGKPIAAASEAGFGISSFIMTNNIRVSILAFASGIFLGIGTIYILINNGLLLGGLAALYTDAGLGTFFWSLILPHGGMELICIFISGAGGLIIGYALINPGSYHRKEWLIKEGDIAVKLLVGTIPMFVLAALIEAYITPLHISAIIKLMFSVFALAGVFAYLGLNGRKLVDRFTNSKN